MTVNGQYFFYETPAPNFWLTMKDVIVEGGCTLAPGTSLFSTVYSSAYPEVENNSTLNFAEALQVNNGVFNFPEMNVDVTEFEKIYVTNYIALLTVDGAESAEKLIANINENTLTAGSQAYSVVDNVEDNATSYWTNYAINPNDVTSNAEFTPYFTAEELAFYIQSGYQQQYIKLLNNINLMNQNWWNGYTDTNQQTNFIVDGNKKTISDVKITGMKDEETAQEGKYLTLFGYAAQVSDLTVKDIAISNEAEIANPYVAAIAVNRLNAVTGLTVNGLTVETETAASYGTVGGFFCNLYSTDNLTNLAISGITNDVPESIAAGYLAGYLNLSVKTPTATLVNPVANYEGEGNPFGKAVITVTAQNQVTPKITVEGFSLDYLKNNVSIVLSTKATQLYSVNVIVDDVTYVLQVQPGETEFKNWYVEQ